MKNLRSTVLWLLFGLASPPLGAQDILVTEVLTLNDSQLADEDGFFSDWLELFNASAVDVPLGGWYLTDDPGELTRWRFPDVTLPAGDYLVVFASSKDRRDPASELHTNFRLTSRGEYLALVEPDGLTVAFDYAPTLPPQFADVSYGLAQGGTGSTLVAEGATASTFVPSNDTLGRSWTLPDFADAGWARGPTGIGYDTGGDYTALIGSDVQARMLGVNPTVYLRLPFDVTDPAAIDRLTLRIRYDDGFVAYLNGQEVSRRNAPAVPTWNSSATAEHGQPETARMAQSFDGGGTGYMLTAHAANVRPRVLTGGPTGRFLELLRDGQGGLANTVGFARVFGPAALVAAEFDFRMPTEAGHAGCCGERADGFGFALVDTAVYGNSGPGPFVGNIVWERPRFPNAFCVGFDIFDGSGNENTVSLNWNGVEVAARRVDQFPLNNGVFNRCRIEIRQDGNASLVRVTIIPDVHGRAGAPAVIFEDHRIPGMTPFDSRVAFGGRTGGAFVALALDNVDVSYSSAVSAEITAEEIDLSPQAGVLRAGRNVLAIQGLNASAGDADFLILPELESFDAGATRADVRQYFTEPTPGLPNGDGLDGVTETPRPSRAPGGFFSPFDLTLDVTSPGATIRYTTNRSEPTASSARFQRPITVSATTVVKAKAFEDGLLPSPTATFTFIRLASSLQNFSSNLPIVIVETFGQGIGQGAQTPVYALFLDGEGARTRITELPNFQGAAGIKVRGSSSTGFPKKQYAFETWDELGDDLAVSILGFADEADYVLYAPYSDKALMRNVLAYRWSNDIGQWAVRTKFVEMFLNTNRGTVGSADYVGLYVFMEKIKRDEARVDIQKLFPSDIRAPQVTGGYILKKDRLDPGDSGFRTNRGQVLAFVEPKEREIHPAQAAWIRGYMNDFESALYGLNFRDPLRGYARYIDTASWIDHHILTETLKNIDGYRLSTFLYKDRGGKLVVGPLWDFNLSLGNANYLQGWLSQGWYYPQLGSGDYPWWGRLFQDPDFRQKYIDRWTELRRDPFDTGRLLADIDATRALLQEAQVRNFQRWPVLGTYVWPNWFIANTYQEEIDWMKGWLRDRLEWIDSTFLPPPTFNQDGGLIDPGFELSMNTRSGTIYYTTDGSDPRLAGGDISASAQVFGSAAGLPLVSSAVSTEVRVLVPANGVLGRSWTQPGFNHAGWRRGSAGIGVGYERGSGYETHIDVDVRGQMDGVNTSVYLRLPFQLADPGEVQSLSLRMRYDDGFVAYLNGVEIARANAPATPSWNAAATGLHDDGAAVVFEGFEVSQHLGDLLAGDNVLAIHGLNESLTSSDMLVEPTLSGSTSLVAEAVVLTEPTHVIARTFNDGEWSGPSEATFVLESDLPIRITEIMYHPRELPEGSPFRRRDIEFIELQNVGSVPVDLSGVRFIEGVFFNFAKGSVKRLLPGEFVLVVRSLPGFEWYYGSEGMNIAGEFLGALDNAGDLLHLIDGTGESIHRFFYDDAWYPETDGAGHSLVSLDPLADPLTWGDAASWAPSGAVDGSPGFEDSAEPPLLVRGFRLPGDANEDGILDISDAVALLRLLFGGGPGPESLPCAGETPGDGGNLAVLDQNGDAVVDLSDAVHVLNYLFLSGSAPVLGTDCVRVAGCSDACVN